MHSTASAGAAKLAPVVSDPWTILAALFLLGIPAASLVHFAVRELRQIRADRDVRQREAQREEARRPLPGSVIIEGEVATIAETPRPPGAVIEGDVAANREGPHQPYVVERRQFGCLGGPIVYDVPSFSLRLPDGRCVSVSLGPDPMLLNASRLPNAAPAAVPPSPQSPAKSSQAGRIYALIGTVRIAGVFFQSEAHLSPPTGRSATIEIM